MKDNGLAIFLVTIIIGFVAGTLNSKIENIEKSLVEADSITIVIGEEGNNNDTN